MPYTLCLCVTICLTSSPFLTWRHWWMMPYQVHSFVVVCNASIACCSLESSMSKSIALADASFTFQNFVFQRILKKIYIDANPVNFTYFTLGSRVPWIRWYKSKDCCLIVQKNIHACSISFVVVVQVRCWDIFNCYHHLYLQVNSLLLFTSHNITA